MSAFQITNRCPKCKGGTFGITTIVQTSTWREFEDGVQAFGPSEASLHDDIASFGKCSCGHGWRLRDPTLNYIEETRGQP